MKRFLIIYIIVTVIIAISLYFVTLVVVTSNRNQTVFDEFSLQAAEDNDFVNFVKYQSVAYQKLSQAETTDYHIHVYQLISQSEDETFNQIVWFVLPKNEVKYATSLDDEDDQTSIILTNNDTTSVFYESDTDPEYRNFAFSYGIEKYGFYFHAPVISESTDISYVLYNYDHEVIYENQIMVTVNDYDPENLGDFSPSFNNQEKEDLLNVGGYFPQALVQNYTVYVLVVLITGFLIFQLKKKSWTH